MARTINKKNIKPTFSSILSTSLLTCHLAKNKSSICKIKTPSNYTPKDHSIVTNFTIINKSTSYLQSWTIISIFIQRNC
jgi:hypothetical protein